MLTLGVDDLDAALKFYRDGLGFESEGIVGEEFEHGAAAFFKLEGGMLLILFARVDLGLDAGIPPGPPSPP
jgi:catechol 2,3-dioxygenase-like lactoylglutathione lyase family enzyme